MTKREYRKVPYKLDDAKSSALRDAVRAANMPATGQFMHFAREDDRNSYLRQVEQDKKLGLVPF